MNIEIIEFYPLEENKITDFLSGTLKVRLPDEKMVIMGIFVSRSKGRYFFSMPGRMSIHHETGMKIRYPSFVFENQEKQKALVEAIRETGQVFIEARLADTERPLNFPPAKTMPQPAPKPSKPASQGNSVASQQKGDKGRQAQSNVIPSKAKPINSKLATLNFVDPPKRTAIGKGTGVKARR